VVSTPWSAIGREIGHQRGKQVKHSAWPLAG
jgi:hypothetical protein